MKRIMNGMYPLWTMSLWELLRSWLNFYSVKFIGKGNNEPSPAESSRGLSNLGNTCFINCVLQSLASSPLFLSYLGNVQEMIDDASQVPFTMDIKTCVSSLRGQVVKRSLFADIFGNAYNPRTVVDALITYNSNFAGYEQQDAHEAFQAIGNMLEEEELEEDEESEASGKEEGEEEEEREEEGGRQTHTQRQHNTPFKGVMSSQLTCLECNTSKPSVAEDFTAISLPIPTMQEAFRARLPEEMQHSLFWKKETQSNIGITGTGIPGTPRIGLRVMDNFLKYDHNDKESHEGLNIIDCLLVSWHLVFRGVFPVLLLYYLMFNGSLDSCDIARNTPLSILTITHNYCTHMDVL